jgi:hypothetical protein
LQRQVKNAMYHANEKEQAATETLNHVAAKPLQL